MVACDVRRRAISSMIRTVLVALSLVALGSSMSIRLPGLIPHELRRERVRTSEMAAVIYTMLKKCAMVCPKPAMRSERIEKCLNSCVSRDVNTFELKFAPTKDVREYIRECPYITGAIAYQIWTDGLYVHCGGDCYQYSSTYLLYPHMHSLVWYTMIYFASFCRPQ